MAVPDHINPASTFANTLIDQFITMGVRHAVISPGSRSTPLALACTARSDLTCHVHHDERSASFMALGIGRATGIPALLVCTSGTAAAQFHAAVIEAHQSLVPMLVLTADRPPELQGVGAPQTIDQTRLYGESVRGFFEPGPPDAATSNLWRHLAVDGFGAAVGATTGRAPGPAHLNLAFREPLIGSSDELPPALAVDLPAQILSGISPALVEELRVALNGRRGVIVAGVRAAQSTEDRLAVEELAEQLGWPILADHLSGVRTHHAAVVGHFDAILRSEPVATELRPEVVLHIGGLVASRVTGEWLAASGAVHIGIDRFGEIPDPDRQMDKCVSADIATAMHQLITVPTEPGSEVWTANWFAVSTAATAAIAESISGEAAAVDAVVRCAPSGGHIVVSSSMPVRDLEWYGSNRTDVSFTSNRGANGIDGVTSTALGTALGSKAPTLCVIGDIAFLHDTNGILGLTQRNAPLCIVVINNDGGGIFSFLPQAHALPPERFELLFGTPHGVDISQLAAAHGVEAVTVIETDQLSETLTGWANDPRPLIIQLISERASNVAAHGHMNNAVRVAVEAALPRV